MKFIYRFIVNVGKVIFIWGFLLVVSISCYSLTIKGKVNYGDRCNEIIDDTFLKEYKYDGVELVDGKLECNTYYVNYISNLDEEANIVFLVSLAKIFYDNNENSDIHVIIESDNYQILSTIVNYQVSYTISFI